jgi:Cys-tRNA(Pro)/Cys-tRNA(Cys) deacylase
MSKEYGIVLSMAFTSPATLHLDSLGLPYLIFTHEQPPRSLEEAARQRGQEASQVIRSILFRAPRETYVMVLVVGQGHISWPRVRSHLEVSRISLATEAQVLAVTGCVIGTVNPLGVRQPVRLLADEGVFQPRQISIGSGVRGTAIILDADILRKALENVEIGEFVARSDQNPQE